MSKLKNKKPHSKGMDLILVFGVVFVLLVLFWTINSNKGKSDFTMQNTQSLTQETTTSTTLEESSVREPAEVPSAKVQADITS